MKRIETRNQWPKNIQCDQGLLLRSHLHTLLCRKIKNRLYSRNVKRKAEICVLPETDKTFSIHLFHSKRILRKRTYIHTYITLFSKEGQIEKKATLQLMWTYCKLMGHSFSVSD